MQINADHRRWILWTVGLAAAGTGVYVHHAATSPRPPSGGSALGLTFGVAGAALMIAAALLSVRKRLRTWRLGSAQTWMKAHLWLGLLAVPCVWFHSSFALGGSLTTAVMVLFYAVIASGIVGLVLQQWIPAALTRRVPLETVHAQIGDVRAHLAADAYELVAAVAGEIPEAVEERALLAAEKEQSKHWKMERLRPRSTPAPRGSDRGEEIKEIYLKEIRPCLWGKRGAAVPDLGRVLALAPEEWHAGIHRLQALCEEARQLRVQERLHAILHAWLIVHAPASIALVVLVAVHAYEALRYAGLPGF